MPLSWQCERGETIDSQMKNPDQNSLLQHAQVPKQMEDSKGRSICIVKNIDTASDTWRKPISLHSLCVMSS